MAISAALIAVIGIFWMMQPTRIVPGVPAAAPSPQEFPADRSTISVGLVLPLETIRKKLEEVLPQSVPFDSTSDARVFGRLTRGLVTVRIDGDRIAAAMPIGGRVQVEKKIAVVNTSVGIDVSGTITAWIDPTLTRDWEIAPHLNIVTKLNQAVAKTPLGDLDVTGLVTGEVAKLAGQTGPQAEAELAKVLGLRPQIEAQWNKLNDSFLVAAAPKTWLRFTPRQARGFQFEVVKEGVSTRLGLECELQLFVQEEKPARLDAPLPPLEIVPASTVLGDQVELALPVVVPYDVLNREATQALAKEPISLPEAKAAVAVSDVKFVPHGDGLLMIVEFSGKQGTLGAVSGTLYLTGRPQYDEATQQFRVAELAYDVDTKNLLLKTADWLLHEKFLEQLRAVAVVNLAGELARAKDAGNQALDALKKQLPRGVVLDAEIVNVDLRPDSLRPFQGAVVGVFYVEGRMSVTLGP